MKESILKRYPELTANDVTLRDDGEDVYIDVWNCIKAQPPLEQVLAWVEEDTNLPQKKSEMELLKSQQVLMQAALDDLIFSGGGF